MKYPKKYLDEIKQRLKVSQIVSQTVKLKKRGKEFIGLSPFSNEKTPSFTVNDEKGFYHCFSSAEHGNIFDFLIKTKNYKFGEAVRELANYAGMLPYKFTKQDEDKEKRWKVYNTILEKYTEFTHKELVYPFEDRGDGDWMAREFFSGGIMPSHKLLLHFSKHMKIDSLWKVNGIHYSKTSYY